MSETESETTTASSGSIPSSFPPAEQEPAPSPPLGETPASGYEPPTAVPSEQRSRVDELVAQGVAEADAIEQAAYEAKTKADHGGADG